MYSNKTYETIKENILSKIDGIDKREGSFVSDMVSPLSLELESSYRELEKLLGIMFLEESTGIYLEKRASEYGIMRKRGSKASGKVVFTGVENAFIPIGSLVGTVTNLLYETTEDAAILPSHTTVEVAIRAKEIGDKYNVLKHTITEIPVGLSGITGVTNSENTLGGSDVETDKELLNRTLMQIQNPATSGNAMHYKLWTLEVDGVGDARVFPLHNGNGTVMVMPITSGKRSVDESIREKVARHIEEERPVGATVTVQSPTEILINVNGQIVLDSNYTLEQVIKDYKEKFKQYIEEGVFKLYTVDYYKCLSLMYEVAGVKQVVDFTLNSAKEHITIQKTQIQVMGTVIITE